MSEIKDFELKLTDFEFPEKLSGNKANFRFVVDLRFIDKHGRFATEHAVMPSLDTFWECDPNRYDKPNYVRGGTKEKPENKFVFKKSGESKKGVDEWDSLILYVRGKSLHSIQFKVIDVDRKDAWDTVKNVLGKVAETVIGKAKSFILKQELPFHTAMGAAADDVQSFLLKKLAGGDKVLFRGSKLLHETEIPVKKAEEKFCEITFEITSGFADKIKEEVETKGAAAVDVRSFLCGTGEEEKFSFRRISEPLTTISGEGTEGNYAITFVVTPFTVTE